MPFTKLNDKDKTEFLKLILDSIVEGFYSIDTQGRITLCNSAFLRMLGFESADEILGREIHSLVHHSHPDGSPYPKEDCPIYQSASTGKSAYIAGEVFFRKDGSQFSVEYRAQPIFKKGVLQGAICTLVDITERKRSEDALLESEARTRLIIDNALDAILSTDSKGIVTEWNKQAEQVFGWTAAEAIGSHMKRMIIPEKYRTAHQKGMERFLKTGEKHILGKRIEIDALNKNGEIFPIELTVTEQMYKGEVYFTAFARDISERKKAEEQLIRARNEAEAANNAKSEFLANMSHELRTPMNAVIGLSNILALSKPLTGKQQEFIKTLQLSANSLLALINDLLDIAKIETQAIELEKIPFDLDEVMQEIVDMLSVQAQEKQLEFIYEMKTDKRRVIGDPTRLRQIIVNLCSNAVKFTEQGAIHIFVTSGSVTQDQEIIHITVQDSGIGIPPEKLSTIFEKFVQADSSISRKYGGTGLGLAITKTLIELMEGSISVESEIGKGSIFKVSIPFILYLEA